MAESVNILSTTVFINSLITYPIVFSLSLIELAMNSLLSLKKLNLVPFRFNGIIASFET